MDGNRFDDLSRRLAVGVTRRRALKGVAAGLLGALGLRAAAGDAAQVTQARCGNVTCKNNPGRCNDGCVCCEYRNSQGRVTNSRCRPPGTCAPGTEACPRGQRFCANLGRCAECCGEGDCGPDGVCLEESCCLPRTFCQDGECGTVDDGCGGTIDCGSCDYGVCVGNMCQVCPAAAAACAFASELGDLPVACCGPGTGCQFCNDIDGYTGNCCLSDARDPASILVCDGGRVACRRGGNRACCDANQAWAVNPEGPVCTGGSA